MTEREIKKLKEWVFSKGINCYIFVFPSGIKFLKKPSTYTKEEVSKNRVFIVWPDSNGFKLTETGFKCKTMEFTGVPSERVEIPFNYIQKVRFYFYNY